MKWFVCLEGTVSMSMEVEADDWRSAQLAAKAVAAKKATPRPRNWTPTVTTRLVEKRIK